MIFIFILFALTSCFNDNHPMDTFINRVEYKTSRELESKYNLEPTSFGSESILGVSSLSLGFRSPNILSIEERRRLIVSSVELFLENINADTNLRPYLLEHPFPTSRISFSIASTAPNPILDLSWTSCTLRHDQIEYSNFEQGVKKVELRESYENAKRRLHEETV